MRPATWTMILSSATLAGSLAVVSIASHARELAYNRYWGANPDQVTPTAEDAENFAAITRAENLIGYATAAMPVAFLVLVGSSGAVLGRLHRQWSRRSAPGFDVVTLPPAVPGPAAAHAPPRPPPRHADPDSAARGQP
jgi:hypothetical protein